MRPKPVIIILLICISAVACNHAEDIPTETIFAVESPPPTTSPSLVSVSPSPSPSLTSPPELTVSPAYPLPTPTKSSGDAVITAYPEPPLSPEEEYQDIPDCSPDSEFGAIKGELHLQTNGPSAGSILYLGEYTGLETTNPIVVVDPARHMHVTTNKEGRFCFSQVPPGTYSLIVWNAGDSMLLKDPSTEYSLQLKVEAGETLDTGMLYTPIP